MHLQRLAVEMPKRPRARKGVMALSLSCCPVSVFVNITRYYQESGVLIYQQVPLSTRSTLRLPWTLSFVDMINLGRPQSVCGADVEVTLGDVVTL